MVPLIFDTPFCPLCCSGSTDYSWFCVISEIIPVLLSRGLLVVGCFLMNCTAETKVILCSFFSSCIAFFFGLGNSCCLHFLNSNCCFCTTGQLLDFTETSPPAPQVISVQYLLILELSQLASLVYLLL